MGGETLETPYNYNAQAGLRETLVYCLSSDSQLTPYSHSTTLNSIITTGYGCTRDNNRKL